MLYLKNSIIQKINKLLYRTGPMRYLVFHLTAQFRKGLVVTFRLKDRVVAEALPSPAFFDDGAFYNTFETHPKSLPKGGILFTICGS